MIKETYEKILNQQEVRKNLIELRKELKDEYNKRAFIYELEEDYSHLYRLLEDEDAKVRKNVALIMGELAIPEFMEKLFEAYNKEEKMFVKGDYLVAIKNFDYRPLLEQLKERLHFLTNNKFEETSLKHVNEEIRVLSEMLLTIERPEMHKFSGYDVLSDFVLLTNRDHKEVTAKQISNGQAKAFGAGLMVRTKDLGEVLKIRTYSDILFGLKGVSTVAADPALAAKAIYEGGLLKFLNERHEGYPPYYFRIEIKSKMELDKKSAFAKKMASELERVSHRELINSTSSYEFEIRLIENKDGAFNVLLKLYTIKDKRFAYRQNTIAASISPVNAALVIELVKEYLRADAQVLDPFCGVGTMLIERNKVVKSKVMYGVDIFGEAIDGAIENSELDNTDIYFINRDYFDFSHKYLFDEVITNMPVRMGRKTEEEIEEVYKKFFVKTLEMVADGATIIMYTRDRGLVERGIRENTEYTILNQYEISKKEGAYVYILKVNK